MFECGDEKYRTKRVSVEFDIHIDIDMSEVEGSIGDAIHEFEYPIHNMRFDVIEFDDENGNRVIGRP